jgi:hypothetical protein
MAKNLKFGNVILSEFGVIGQNNKHTLINTYSGDIIVSDFPAELFFCLFVEILDVKEDIKLLLSIFLNKNEVAKLEAVIPSQSSGAMNGILFVPSFTIGLPKPAVFSIAASADGFSTKTIIKKDISRGVIPVAPSIVQMPL